MYFQAFPQASVRWTAVSWVATVVLLDLFVVAALVERSMAMFRSPLGTWIPLGLIFLSTLTVGNLVSAQRAHADQQPAEG